MSSQRIQKLYKDKKLLHVTKKVQEKTSIGRIHLEFLSRKEYLGKEMKWFKSNLVKLLKNYVKDMQITAYSK